jgi:hypothetical protein
VEICALLSVLICLVSACHRRKTFHSGISSFSSWLQWPSSSSRHIFLCYRRKCCTKLLLSPNHVCCYSNCPFWFLCSSLGHHFRSLYESDNRIIHAIYDESQKIVESIFTIYTKPDWHRNYFSSLNKDSMFRSFSCKQVLIARIFVLQPRFSNIWKWQTNWFERHEWIEEIWEKFGIILHRIISTYWLMFRYMQSVSWSWLWNIFLQIRNCYFSWVSYTFCTKFISDLRLNSASYALLSYYSPDRLTHC